MDPIPVEIRAQVLAACDAGEGTRVVAVRFCVSESWVRRAKQQRRETGQVAPKIAAPREPIGKNGRTGWWRRSPLSLTFICASCRPISKLNGTKTFA